jgi:8-oxo-dGTP pyrophosphatase MutT (NUDIX family)
MLSFYTLLHNILPSKKEVRPINSSAGCFFTDGKLYLAGYQPKKKNPYISGIGGHVELGEDEFEAALREVIEELLEVHPVPKDLLKELLAKCVPKRRVCNNSYTIFEFSFNDLESILKHIETHKIQSPLYNTFPTTISELVFQRLIRPALIDPEITHLVVLPFVDHPLHNELLSPCLRSDVHILRSSTPLE